MVGQRHRMENVEPCNVSISLCIVRVEVVMVNELVNE